MGWNIFSCIKRCVGGFAPVACQSGSYSLLGKSSCSVCPKGFFCQNNATQTPVPCPISTFSNDTSAVSCSVCPVAHECLDSSQTPVSCLDGYYSPGGKSVCQICPAGYR